MASSLLAIRPNYHMISLPKEEHQESSIEKLPEGIIALIFLGLVSTSWSNLVTTSRTFCHIANTNRSLVGRRFKELGHLRVYQQLNYLPYAKASKIALVLTGQTRDFYRGENFFQIIKGLPHDLRGLDISFREIDNHHLCYLPKGLKKLKIYKCPITEKGIKYLLRLKDLTHLNIHKPWDTRAATILSPQVKIESHYYAGPPPELI